MSAMIGLVKALKVHVPSRDLYADVSDEIHKRDGNEDVVEDLKKMDSEWSTGVADNLEKVVEKVSYNC